MKPHIAIIGSALTGNKGAASMLEAAVDQLVDRFPDARFTLLSMYPKEDAAQNRYPSLQIVDARPVVLGALINSLALLHRAVPPLRPLLRKHAAIRALHEADILLDQGGITFVDGREKFLIYNVASILPALFMQVPVFKCAQAMGPFRGWLNRKVAKLFLPNVHTIISRGRISHEHLLGLGLTNVEAGADLAFVLDHHDEATGSDQGNRKSELIGVAPSVVIQKKIEAEGRDYVGEMADFITYVAGRGLRIQLIPHSVRSGTNRTHNNDLPLCREIYRRLSDQSRDVTGFEEREIDPRTLRGLIADCDVLVTSRFHAMVSGLATATPTLVIGWNHKYEEVLEMFGAENWALAHQDYSNGTLQARFEELFEARERVAARLAEALPGVRAKSEGQIDRIVEIVGGIASAR